MVVSWKWLKRANQDACIHTVPVSSTGFVVDQRGFANFHKKTTQIFERSKIFINTIISCIAPKRLCIRKWLEFIHTAVSCEIVYYVTYLFLFRNLQVIVHLISPGGLRSAALFIWLCCLKCLHCFWRYSGEISVH